VVVGPMTLLLTYRALTDVGVERSENQDACGQATSGDFEFYFTCDGMGGHRGGSTASTMAVELITSTLATAEGDIEARMQAAIEAANAAIHDLARRRRDLNGMGTTVVMVAIDRAAGTAHVAHVGDSRAYRLRGNVYRRITKDHTWVQRLVDDGVLTPEAAEHHPHSNVISRSLGGRPDVEIEFTTVAEPLVDGEIFLLCSDGLSGLASDEEVVRIVADCTLDDAPAALVKRACDAGGHDNVTVQLILVGEKAGALSSYVIEHPPNGHGAVIGRNTVPTSAVTPATASRAQPDDGSDDDSGAGDPFGEPLHENEERGSGTLIVVLAAAIGVVLILLATLRVPEANPDAVIPEQAAPGSGVSN
jgi:serine/threonine protein phosphatase PrpC